MLRLLTLIDDAFTIHWNQRSFGIGSHNIVLRIRC